MRRFPIVAAIVSSLTAAAHGQKINEDAALRAVEHLPGLKTVVVRFDQHYSKDSVHAIMYVEALPNDSNSVQPGYYSVYVGESHTDHTVRWFTVLVGQDLKKLRLYDDASDRVYPIREWRHRWPATQFLKRAR